MSNGLLVPNDLDKNKYSRVDLKSEEYGHLSGAVGETFSFSIFSLRFLITITVWFIMTTLIIMTFQAHKLGKD